MKEKSLEDFIKANKAEFNASIPSEDIWLKIYLAINKWKRKKIEFKNKKIR